VYGTSAAALIVPFIALCFLSVMVDRAVLVLEEVMHRIPWLPNKFWAPVAYLIVFVAGYVICWRGNFCFFTSLGFAFNHACEGWLMTALLISGGSTFVKQTFGIVNSIPQAVSMVYGFFSSPTSTTTTPGTSSNPELPP
jgi:hypothetical protein